MFHKIKNVTPLDDYVLLVHFIDGTEKTYDIKPLFEKIESFRILKTTPGLFKLVRVDIGGYGIVWNEDVDLDGEELWQNGKNTATAFSGLMSMSDATSLWGLNESTLRKAITYGKLIPGIDAFNFGSQWVVTAEAMEKKYGHISERQGNLSTNF